MQGGGEEVQQVEQLVQDCVLQVQTGVQHGQDASDTRPVQQESLCEVCMCEL